MCIFTETYFVYILEEWSGIKIGGWKIVKYADDAILFKKIRAHYKSKTQMWKKIQGNVKYEDDKNNIKLHTLWSYSW